VKHEAKYYGLYEEIFDTQNSNHTDDINNGKEDVSSSSINGNSVAITNNRSSSTLKEKVLSSSASSPLLTKQQLQQQQLLLQQHSLPPSHPTNRFISSPSSKIKRNDSVGVVTDKIVRTLTKLDPKIQLFVPTGCFVMLHAVRGIGRLVVDCIDPSNHTYTLNNAVVYDSNAWFWKNGSRTIVQQYNETMPLNEQCYPGGFTYSWRLLLPNKDDNSTTTTTNSKNISSLTLEIFRFFVPVTSAKLLHHLQLVLSKHAVY
jgi:hypothetical protein